MIKKVLHVALRDFIATVATKGFVVGILITPLLITVLIIALPKLMKNTAPKVTGEVAVIDPTGAVGGLLRDYLKPEKMAERREELKKKIDEATPAAVKAMASSSPQGRIAMDQSMAAALGDVPQIDVKILEPGSDLEAAKEPLKETSSGGRDRDGGLLALVVVHSDAIARAPGNEKFGTYDLFIRNKLDDRLEDEIKDGMRESIVNLRVQTSGLDRALVEALTHTDRVRSTTVTAGGEHETNELFNVFLPMAFMILILMSVMTSGQYLLTTTVEEKSNRVVEVLLSAVSPMELMVGKILGQMAVGFLILILYAGLGVAALVSFAMIGLLDFKLLIFLFVFYVLAFFTIASLMAAIGSAVNEMREAQTLMTPVMLLIMIPWMLWMPITRDPNGTFATVTSFIPPISNFVMLLRLTSTSPPPMWQAFLAIFVGMVGVCVAVWFAAKVFRIGLLMFGKPPSFGTLIKWARMS